MHRGPEKTRSVILAALAALVAACGSSNDNPATTNPVTQSPGTAGIATTTAGRPQMTVAGNTTPAATSGRSGSAALAGTSGSTTTPIVTAGTSASAGISGVAGASGTAGATVGAAGGGSTPTQFGMDAGEYFVSGTWHGYVWTAANGMGSSITPMDFKMQTTGMPRCVKGTVAATADYSGTASLGFDIAEDRSGTGIMAVAPTKGGVMVTVSNNGGSELRVQVQGPDGAATGPWCAPLTGSGGFVPWTSFNTKCWDGTGTAYANEPIAKISVLVPGKNMDAVAFDFCVNALAEADGAATQPSAGSAAPTAGQSGSGTTNPPAGGTSGGSVTPVQGSCNGYVTGYWDCCKPHCGWKGNVPSGVTPLAACSMSDQSLGADYDAKNACEAGGTAYQCHNLVPWAVNDKLAYGYAAVGANADKDICGKCYQLQFTGNSFNSEPDPGSTALAGKTVIVQAINIGSDVQNGQFDMLIPGRGVGMFDACSSQWGVAKSDLGEQYGGFLLKCQKAGNRTDHAAMKACVMQSCMNVFEAHGLSELAAGCEWFVNWFQVADNPSMKYQEVTCPAELSGKGLQRNTQPSNACLR